MGMVWMEKMMRYGILVDEQCDRMHIIDEIVHLVYLIECVKELTNCYKYY